MCLNGTGSEVFTQKKTCWGCLYRSQPVKSLTHTVVMETVLFSHIHFYFLTYIMKWFQQSHTWKSTDGRRQQGRMTSGPDSLSKCSCLLFLFHVLIKLQFEFTEIMNRVDEKQTRSWFSSTDLFLCELSLTPEGETHRFLLLSLLFTSLCVNNLPLHDFIAHSDSDE